ncbi:hypothetical protein VNO78_00546 [Psophocarpus tetragonolobus]|uniref:Uncharacterized protein n=1 Tax=Psophocarpus tetragonolobus TaxID=3891 RepID=A0AAN9SX80_PSOTE
MSPNKGVLVLYDPATRLKCGRNQHEALSRIIEVEGVDMSDFDQHKVRVAVSVLEITYRLAHYFGEKMVGWKPRIGSGLEQSTTTTIYLPSPFTIHLSPFTTFTDSVSPHLLALSIYLAASPPSLFSLSAPHSTQLRFSDNEPTKEFSASEPRGIMLTNHESLPRPKLQSSLDFRNRSTVKTQRDCMHLMQTY